MIVAGKDYPSNLLEFQEFFPTEAACRQYLTDLRWPKGFVCPTCGAGSGAWNTERGLLLCRGCRHQASVTAGTIFEGTRTPLRTWLLAVWEVTSHTYGASTLGVQRALGLPSYKTAWAWLHKLRRAMVRPDRDRLSGEVEVDETYVGGEEVGVRGRGTNRKALVAVAVELKPTKTQGKRIGRVRLRRVPDASEPSVLGFVTTTNQILTGDDGLNFVMSPLLMEGDIVKQKNQVKPACISSVGSTDPRSRRSQRISAVSRLKPGGGSSVCLDGVSDTAKGAGGCDGQRPARGLGVFTEHRIIKRLKG